MNQELEQIKEQQRESWNTFSPGWKKWDEITMKFLQPMGNEIISMLKLKDGDNVLDVATGTGEPGLTIAAGLKNGKVIGTDVSEGMLAIAAENAKKRNISNYETLASDVTNLPFEDNTFDAISCRFGFMFFPDMVLAAKELNRILKPGGRLATSVWNVAAKNFWVTVSMGTINQHMQLSAPPAGAPGMFRCADEKMMEDVFRQGRFKNISYKEVTGKLPCGTADVYWNMMTEVAAPFVASLSKADDTLKATIKKEVLQKINDKYPDGNVAIDSSAVIFYAEK